MHESVAILTELAHKLDAKDRNFASSLCQQFKTKGKLSDKQAYWLDRLANKALSMEAGVPDFTETVVQVGDMSGVVSLFNTAGSKLKSPKITFNIEGVGMVRLYVLGGKSRYPGAINVTDGGPYNNNKWYGRVHLDGRWEPGSDAQGENLDRIAKILTALSKDPAGTASAYGKKSGRCCFCNSKLTDDKSGKSVQRGYGPVCAANYGMPWG